VLYRGANNQPIDHQAEILSEIWKDWNAEHGRATESNP
jgi:hypothetical protein